MRASASKKVKAPSREPLDPREPARRQPAGAALPPSERGTVEPERRAIGVFRLAGWGWGVTIALALLSGAVVVIGYLRDDPGRNPAPVAYREAVCAAAAELAAGTAVLEEGVEVRGDRIPRQEAQREIDDRVAAANDALSGLPAWLPGRTLDELLGAQIITLTNGAAALESGPVERDLETAQVVDAQLREQLDAGRYGFTCAG